MNDKTTGRRPEVTDEQIIAAGTALLADGRKVTGFALRKALDNKGTPERLSRVWEAHLLQKSATTTEAQTQDLPIEIEDALTAGGLQIAQAMKSMAENIHRIATRLAERRVAEIHVELEREKEDRRSEMKDASDTVEDLERVGEELKLARDHLAQQLAEAQRENGALVSDNSKLKEQVTQQAGAIKEATAEVGQLQTKLHAAEESAAEAKRTTAVIEDRLTSLAQKHDQLTIAHNAVLDQNNERKEALSVANVKLEQAEQRIQDFHRRAEEHRIELHRANEVRLQQERQLEKSEERLVNAETKLAEAERQMAELQAQVADLQARKGDSHDA